MTWGDGFTKAFEAATVRLMTTGTPFRQRRHLMTASRSKDATQQEHGQVVCNFSYDWSQLLQDNAVRPVDVQAAGQVGWISRKDREEYRHDITEVCEYE